MQTTALDKHTTTFDEQTGHKQTTALAKPTTAHLHTTPRLHTAPHGHTQQHAQPAPFVKAHNNIDFGNANNNTC